MYGNPTGQPIAPLPQVRLMRPQGTQQGLLKAGDEVSRVSVLPITSWRGR